MLEIFDSKDGLSDIAQEQTRTEPRELGIFARDDVPAKPKSASTRIGHLDTLPTEKRYWLEMNSLGQNCVSLSQIKTEPNASRIHYRK